MRCPHEIIAALDPTPLGTSAPDPAEGVTTSQVEVAVCSVCKECFAKDTGGKCRDCQDQVLYCSKKCQVIPFGLSDVRELPLCSGASVQHLWDYLESRSFSVFFQFYNTGTFRKRTGSSIDWILVYHRNTSTIQQNIYWRTPKYQTQVFLSLYLGMMQLKHSSYQGSGQGHSHVLKTSVQNVIHF